ncbi:hypothetical protein M0R45_035691 [Rubus argutus]|uniref:Uncharacterized protein n=1 Tax=Rubus argutus TaxID=59490 RepID=A0AAW1VXM3_RUBAR
MHHPQIGLVFAYRSSLLFFFSDWSRFVHLSNSSSRYLDRFQSASFIISSATSSNSDRPLLQSSRRCFSRSVSSIPVDLERPPFFQFRSDVKLIGLVRSRAVTIVGKAFCQR